MAGILTSVSSKSKINLSNKKFAIVVAEWNDEITEPLYEGALQALLDMGAKKKNVIRKSVPGSFELPLAAQWMSERKDISAVICLGCVILSVDLSNLTKGVYIIKTQTTSQKVMVK